MSRSVRITLCFRAVSTGYPHVMRFAYATGVLAIGRIERSDDTDGLPVRDGPVIARVSKGLGLPGGTRDIAGLALRLPTTVSGGPWDLLMASAGGPGTWMRRLPRPSGDWHTVDFSSLTPFEHDGRRWWVRARCITPIPSTGLSLNGFADVLHRDGVEFALMHALSGQRFRTFGWLTLRGVHQADSAPAADRHRLDGLRHR